MVLKLRMRLPKRNRPMKLDPMHHITRNTTKGSDLYRLMPHGSKVIHAVMYRILSVGVMLWKKEFWKERIYNYARAHFKFCSISWFFTNNASEKRCVTTLMHDHERTLGCCCVYINIKNMRLSNKKKAWERAPEHRTQHWNTIIKNKKKIGCYFIVIKIDNQ